MNFATRFALTLLFKFYLNWAKIRNEHGNMRIAQTAHVKTRKIDKISTGPFYRLGLCLRWNVWYLLLYQKKAKASNKTALTLNQIDVRTT